MDNKNLLHLIIFIVIFNGYNVIFHQRFIMQRFGPLLLDIWREACRHIAIEESISRIAAILAKRMPIECVMVRRFDISHGVETVAAGVVGKHKQYELTRYGCSQDQMESLLAWCRSGEILHPDDAGRNSGLFSCVVPPGVRGDVLIGPLSRGDEPIGTLLLIASALSRFDENHTQMLDAICEPLSVAVQNHDHLREMASLREAAEADRRSLLAKMGRQSLEEPIIGMEGGLKEVMDRVELVSSSDVPVLILGETGSGKEVIARAIHSRSKREQKPFLRVNCGAIPHELIDSELFGHERGSFTGAETTRKGWFERADGGSLFLDEIGELPHAAQVRLLRILQDGTFERVGGQVQMCVDVRVIAATHRDLGAMVREGRFREDLWYRVAVFPVLLPPLRERPEDIPVLARHFAQRAAIKFGLAVQMPTQADIQRMLEYTWPGNVRELAAVINRAAILGNGSKLEIVTALGGGGDHGFPVLSPHTSTYGPGRVTMSEYAESELPVSLDEAVRRHIESALMRTGGRVDGPHGAARLLQVNPHTLRSKMRKLGISRHPAKM